MANITYPLINGVRYDHSSLDIKIAAVSFFGIKSIDYSDTLEPGEGRGTGPQIVIRTRGNYSAQASMEVWRAEYDAFALQISQSAPGTGLYEIAWPLDIHYQPEGGLAMVTDNIVGCRIKTPSHNSSAGGTDPLAVKVDLHVMYIIKNGINPITNLKL